MKSAPMLTSLLLVIIPVLMTQIPLFADAGVITASIAAVIVLVLNTVLRLIEATKPVLEPTFRSASVKDNKSKWFWLG